MGTRPYLTSGRRTAMLLRLMSGLLIAGTATAPALAAPRSQTATGKAIVLRQLSFFKVQDLDFGSMIPGTTGGVVRVLPDGTRTATGTVVLVGNTQAVARFAGLGTYNEQVDISMSSNSIQLTGPGAPMTASLFEIGSTPTAILTTTPTRFRIGSTLGNFNFPVGASLTVNANQAPGNYAGTFTITLNYL